MTATQLKDKVLTMEAELEVIKQAIQAREPDFAIDEKQWRGLKKDIKRTRANLYKQRYEKN